MAKKKNGNCGNLEPQKSSAAQFITYVASTGESDEKYEQGRFADIGCGEEW